MGEPAPDVAADGVIRMVGRAPGGPEDGHARPRLLQPAKSANEIAQGTNDEPELAASHGCDHVRCLGRRGERVRAAAGVNAPMSTTGFIASALHCKGLAATYA